MKKANVGSGFFFLAISILICVESLRFDFGKWSEPGPGFLPFWCGLIMASLSSFLVIQAISKEPSIPGAKLFGNIRWRKWLLALGSILGYALLLESLGFLLCTLLLMTILLAFVEPQRWIVVFLVATITTSVAYIIFQWTLKAQLPRGIIGI